MIESIILNLI